MTISTTANRVSYTGNGATTAFNFPYPYRVATDLVVIVRTIATGAESVKTSPTDYTLSGVTDVGTGGFSSGTVTFVSAPTSAQEVHIVRNVSPVQTADYTAGSGINPPTLEGGLDLLSLAAQYAADGFDRVLRGKRTDAALSEIPNSVSRASKMLAFDSNGQPIVSTGTLSEIEAATLAAPEATVKGRASGSGTGSPVNLTGTQLNAILPNFGGATSSLDGSRGIVPQPLAGDEGKFLKGDGTFAIPTTNVAVNSITYDKLQDVSATNRVLGRSSAGAGDVEEIACTAAGRALIAGADATAQRTTLGLGTIATEAATTYLTVSTASSTYQPLDSDLTAIAALTTAAYGRNLLTTTSEANFKASVNLEIGVDVQAYDADLATIAGLADPNADRILFWDDSAGAYTYLTPGTNLSISGTTLNATGGGGLSDGDYGDIVVSGGGTVLSIDTGVATTFGRSLMDDADAATARTTLGLVIGTNVQAYDAELAALAGLTSAADALPYFTGVGTASTTGTIAAALAASGQLFYVRWTDATRFFVLHRFKASFQALTPFTAATLTDFGFDLVKATAVSAGGGGTDLGAVVKTKMRTSMGASLLDASGLMRISTTAALTAITTLDGSAIASSLGDQQSLNPAAGTEEPRVNDPTLEYVARMSDGEYPLVLAQNEGLVLRNRTVWPAAGTGIVTIEMSWSEVAAF